MVWQRVITQEDIDQPEENLFSALRSSTSTWLHAHVATDLSPILRYASKELSGLFQRQYLKHWKSHPARAYPTEVEDELWQRYIDDITKELAPIVKRTVLTFRSKPTPPSPRDVAIVENIPFRLKLVTTHPVFLGTGAHSHSPVKVPLLCQAYLNDIVSLHCDASRAVTLVCTTPIPIILQLLIQELDRRTHGSRLQSVAYDAL